MLSVELGSEDSCPGRSSLLGHGIVQMGWSQKGTRTTKKLHSWEKMSLSTFAFPPYHPKPSLKYFFSFVTCAQQESVNSKRAWDGIFQTLSCRWPCLGTWNNPHPKIISLNNQPWQLCTFLHKTLAFASSSGTKQEIYTFQPKFGDPRLIFFFWKPTHTNKSVPH